MTGVRSQISEDDAKLIVSQHPLVSRETMGSIEQFIAALRRWSRAINLVAPNEHNRLWSRHVLDSFGLVEHLDDQGVWLDIGSGGGFPALPLAIVSRETYPNLRFRLVESDKRKAAFLREVIRTLDLAAEVKAERVERLEPQKPRLISARAFAELKNILSYTENHREISTKMVLLKGEKLHDELTAASAEWHMRYQAERHPLTRNGYMLIIREAKRAKLR